MCLVESTSTQREPREINLTETNSANSTSTNKCLSSNVPQTDSHSEIQQVNNQTLNRETPKQTELKAEIAKIESKITSLIALKESFKKSPKSIEREKSKAANINIRCSKAAKTACGEKENHLRVVQSKHLQCLKTKKVHSHLFWPTSTRGYISRSSSSNCGPGNGGSRC